MKTSQSRRNVTEDRRTDVHRGCKDFHFLADQEEPEEKANELYQQPSSPSVAKMISAHRMSHFWWFFQVPPKCRKWITKRATCSLLMMKPLFDFACC